MRRHSIALILCLTSLSSTCSHETLARGRLGGGRIGGMRSVPRGGFSGRGIPSGGFSRGSIQSRSPSRQMPSRTVNRSPSLTVPRPETTRLGSSSTRSSGSRIGQNRGSASRTGVTIRPGIGSGRLQPGSRPQIGSTSRIGTGARTGTEGSRIGSGQFPGLGSRTTSSLPGLGSGNAAQQLQQRFPDLNRETLRQQISAAGDSSSITRDKLEAWRQQQGTQRARIPERRQNLQDRLENVDREQWQQRRDDIREDRQDFREGRREDWQQHREGAREDWQDWYDDRYYYHYSWHHGCWHDGWYGYWDHMWDEHPVAVAFGLTCWGANTMAYMFGTTDYSNPYYAGPESGSPTDYSQPQINVQQSVEAGTESELPSVPDEGIRAFEEARSAFHTGKYDEALRLTDDALKQMPHDAVVHEFRALIFFAKGRYMEAAATLHSVLAVGPGWDWTTMSQLYPSIEDYTAQLRTLEAWTKERPALPDGHFVLAYHYMTCGHRDDAVEQLRVVVKALPDDTVSARLLNMLTGETPATSSPADVEQASPAFDRSDLNADQLTGTWTAKKDDATFTLDLKADARFTWTFEEGGQSQSVSGVYALDGFTLAMEPDSGGAMLAELRLDGTKMSFQQVGAPADDAILVFERE